MIKGTKIELQNKLRGRFLAYGHVFDPQNQFTREVLEDLAKFCRAHTSTFHADPRKAANLDGRREVWLRIQQYLRFDLEEIYKLHNLEGD